VDESGRQLGRGGTTTKRELTVSGSGRVVIWDCAVVMGVDC